MRKIATMFLLLVSVALLCSGAAFAEAYVDVAILDEEENPIDEATEGDTVLVGAYVDANDTGLTMPYVEITLNPEDGLEFDPDDARMTTDGVNWINNDPLNPFFFWYAPDQVWVWDIHMITGNMDPFEKAEMLLPATVATTGYITVEGDLYQHITQEEGFVDSDSYTILALPRQPSTNATTVPMEETGAPLALAVLGLLGVAGGIVYSRIR